MSTLSHFVITGGHHNSALVIAQQLKKLGHQVSWIGHRYASVGDKADSAEYREVTHSGINFYQLSAGKSGNYRQWLKVPSGIIRAKHLLAQLQPNVILSFGGYLGFGVALAGYWQRIPIFLHEQTVLAGKANKLTSKFAQKIYLTWESSREFFPAHKTLLVGLPLRQSILNPPHTTLFNNSKPTILILGGKQGSHVINQLIFQNLSQLLSQYNLIHQTGTSTVTQDYQLGLALKQQLNSELTTSYQVYGYIDQQQIGKYLANCDIYLGRSGAHITYELGVLGIPSVLIPFMSTHAHEQLHNARYLVNHKLGVILPQDKLNFTQLQQALSQLNHQSISPLPLKRNATETLIKDLLYELSH